MTISNAEERGILALMFGYTSFGAALRAMDAYGDERSATLVSEVRSVWEGSGTVPDLSHENRFGHVRLNPSREDVILACTGMIDAFDSTRESNDRARLSLRKTIEVLFELRAFARLQPPETAPRTACDGTSDILQRELSAFPLSAGQLNKLKRGGYLRLGELSDSSNMKIAGKCGLTENQVANVHGILNNYFLATVRLEDITFRSRFEELGKELLGGDFEPVVLTSDVWLQKYFDIASSCGLGRHGWKVYLEAMSGGSEPVLEVIKSVFEELKERAPAGEPSKSRAAKADSDPIYCSRIEARRHVKALIARPEWIHKPLVDDCWDDEDDF